MDIEVILDAAEAGAPGLRELAGRFPEAGTRHLGVPLDAASVMARRSEGVPEVHITGAAGRLPEHLAATEPDPLNDGAPSWRWRAPGRRRGDEDRDRGC